MVRADEDWDRYHLYLRSSRDHDRVVRDPEQRGLRQGLIDNYSTEIGRTAEMLSEIIKGEEEATSQEERPDDPPAQTMRRDFRNQTTTELIKRIGDVNLNRRTRTKDRSEVSRTKATQEDETEATKTAKRGDAAATSHDNVYVDDRESRGRHKKRV